MNIVKKQPQMPVAAPTPTEWDPFRMMRDLMRWDPFREMAPLPLGETKAFFPDVDVKETPTDYVFRADLPGIKEKDLEISVTGNRITLSGKREEERKDEKGTYYSYERSFGSFSRVFTLPEGTDVDHVRAELKDGVLTVTLPKKPEVQPRKIAVQGGAPEAKAKA